MSLEDDEDHDKIGVETFADLEPLEELDDAEFGLPPVDNPPTLEEILNEDDDLQRTVDDFDDEVNSSFAGFSEPLSSLSNALQHLGLEGLTLLLRKLSPSLRVLLVKVGFSYG